MKINEKKHNKGEIPIFLKYNREAVNGIICKNQQNKKWSRSKIVIQ